MCVLKPNDILNVKNSFAKARVLRSRVRRTRYCVNKMALKVRSEIRHFRPFKARPHAFTGRLVTREIGHRYPALCSVRVSVSVKMVKPSVISGEVRGSYRKS